MAHGRSRRQTDRYWPAMRASGKTRACRTRRLPGNNARTGNGWASLAYFPHPNPIGLTCRPRGVQPGQPVPPMRRGSSAHAMGAAGRDGDRRCRPTRKPLEPARLRPRGAQRRSVARYASSSLAPCSNQNSYPPFQRPCSLNVVSPPTRVTLKDQRLNTK